MTRNKKLDYLLNIIRQFPNKTDPEIAELVKMHISTEECYKLIDELFEGGYIKREFKNEVNLTTLGRDKLSNPFAKEEKERRKKEAVDLKLIRATLKAAKFNKTSTIINLVLMLMSVAAAIYTAIQVNK